MHDIEIGVSDGRGGVVTQPFSIDVVVSSDNTAPEIVSNAVLGAVSGFACRYQARAEDREGDSVLWSLLTAPSGMLVDPLTGLVRWDPTTDQLSEHEVVLQAQDPQLGSSSQSFTLTVRATLALSPYLHRLVLMPQ